MGSMDETKIEREGNGNGRSEIKIFAAGSDTFDGGRDVDSVDANIVDGDLLEKSQLERALVRSIDWRLCTIAGILCSLNLLDSGIISSASVTTWVSLVTHDILDMEARLKETGLISRFQYIYGLGSRCWKPLCKYYSLTMTSSSNLCEW